MPDFPRTGGMTNPMTTQDDLIVGGSSGTPARLAKGSDGQVLTVDPSTHHLVWATPSAGALPGGHWKLVYEDGSGVTQELALGAAATYLRSAGASAAPTMSVIAPVELVGGNWKLLYTNGSGVVTELALGSSGKVLTSNGASSAPTFETPSGGSALPFLCYQDQKTQNTGGGTFTSGAWRTRDLNTEVADTGSHGSVASNQITLDAGTYQVLATAPAYEVSFHQMRLRDTTNSATLVTGTSHYTASTIDVVELAVLAGRFTLSGSTVIELQHQCGITKASIGFGAPDNFGTEVYASVMLWKES